MTFEAHRSMRTWKLGARAGPRASGRPEAGLELVWAHGAEPTLRHDGPPLDMQQAFSWLRRQTA